MMKTKNIAIILAGGDGVRFGENEIPKQFAKVAGKTLLEHTIEVFDNNKNIDVVNLVVHPHFFNFCKEIIKNNDYKKVKKIIKGGKTRQESSRIGLSVCIANSRDKVLIHDSVRPFVDDQIIDSIINALDKFPAVDVAIPLADTLIKVDGKNTIIEIPKREDFKRGQTPQGFHFEIIRKAHEMAVHDGLIGLSDDCGLVIRYDLGKVFVVNGKEENIKVTYPLDIHIADKIFQLKSIFISSDLNARDLQSKNIVIFGHTSGIGREIYNICKRADSNVIGFSKSMGVDVTDPKLVSFVLKDFVEKNGKIDILISTVGILTKSNLSDTSIEAISNEINTNLTSQIYIVKEAIKKMAKNSSIALFTSSSYTRGRGTYSVYSATKSAIVNFVQGVAEEIIDSGIKINAICPDRTKTPLRRKNFGLEPRRTLLDPKMVAKLTLQTCLSDLTGQVVNVRK